MLKPSDPAAAFEALTRLGLQDKLYERVDRLSGGERQRCGIARLLLSNAEVLLVDEPLSALDPTLSLQTLMVLQQHATTRRATLICSLHHVEFARAYFPRIIGLREGRMVFDLARSAVTDKMVSDLYHNGAENISPQNNFQTNNLQTNNLQTNNFQANNFQQNFSTTAQAMPAPETPANLDSRCF